MKVKFLLMALLFGACSLGSGDQKWKLAQSYIVQKQYLRAIEEYSRIVNHEQKGLLAIKAQRQITLIYENHLKDYPRAIRSEREIYRRSNDPKVRLQVRIRVADIYLHRLGDFNAASDEYENIFTDFGYEFSGAPDLLLKWADALMENANFKEASVKYHEFQSKFPGNPQGPRVLFLEAQAYLADEKYEIAIESFRKLIRNYGQAKGYEGFVAESYYGLGMAFEAQDDLAKALAAYRSSLARYPNPRVVEVKIERLQKRKKERRL